jgi:hypothetical protein
MIKKSLEKRQYRRPSKCLNCYNNIRIDFQIWGEGAQGGVNVRALFLAALASLFWYCSRLLNFLLFR